MAKNQFGGFFLVEELFCSGFLVVLLVHLGLEANLIFLAGIVADFVLDSMIEIRVDLSNFVINFTRVCLLLFFGLLLHDGSVQLVLNEIRYFSQNSHFQSWVTVQQNQNLHGVGCVYIL